ncbi:hypothetical protein PR202_gb12461 [Eleusine coracana subsp. coracana]|uniref:Uncharacterized protein n=1 Tax=Eleusine coracana subsp. coracana TaxID=191504 RepID=A0AAV5ERF8_ELECO|nr:hypothetical protein PR202_gb12461 [Eleusine coracana subsp. coracana]
MAPPCLPYLVDELVGEILLRLDLHHTPPLLGFLHNLYDSGPVPRFVPAIASPCSPPALGCISYWVLDCHHSRALIHSFGPTDLVVWDPITRGQQRVPLPSFLHSYYTGAVLCAVDGCDHLDCHGGPFRVVFVGTDDRHDIGERLLIGDRWVERFQLDCTGVSHRDVAQPMYRGCAALHG